MKKIANVLLTVFSVGIIASVLAGGLSLVGYIVALCIGGDIATEICTFVFKTYLPWVIRLTAIFAGFGLVGMYLNRQKSLTVSSEAKDNK